MLYAGVVGATAMNVSSSRSHAIFTITVESSQIGEDGEQHVKMGKLHLVDLAVRVHEESRLNTHISPSLHRWLSLSVGS